MDLGKLNEILVLCKKKTCNNLKIPVCTRFSLCQYSCMDWSRVLVDLQKRRCTQNAAEMVWSSQWRISKKDKKNGRRNQTGFNQMATAVQKIRRWLQSFWHVKRMNTSESISNISVGYEKLHKPERKRWIDDVKEDLHQRRTFIHVAPSSAAHRWKWTN